MKQSLQLRLSQQLAMTPQLQQAIRLLQLSTLELQHEIQQALETNPLLEQDDLYQEIETSDINDNEPATLDSFEAIEQNDMPDELPLDTNWEEIYTSDSYPSLSNNFSDNDFPLYQGETLQTLQDYLSWQASLTPFTEIDAAIATAIIDAVDDSGYLSTTIEDIYTGLALTDITLEEVEIVLKRIQHFDPIGVAAKNLKDCLLIQLSALPNETPFLKEAKLIINDHLELLGNRDFRQLSRKTKLKEAALKEVIAMIQRLDPKPGQVIQTKEPQYIVPDALVRKIDNDWQVALNTENIPRLKINQHYASLGKYSGNEEDNQFIRNNLQEAKWLIKSLESRNETLLKVAQCIVENQQEFFEYGEEHMKPMVLADIAYQVDMHESTISRVTSQKYLHSPRGIFELKYFFSSHVNTDTGGEASSIAIRALVKKLIAAENPVKPLSDNKLTSILAEQGIQIARRTVAKYRESLSIPPSNQRKKLI
ncbi:RNA polymerase factor sigma-54 [Arsenophonus nasoniae]|uniref:RNA polymerase sigma-54 factor n=1 Tax=Arsenophonus nasoniae TaxID=638 RepID=D2U2M9_9GAMM|nr:RNA polymerase factor sigma-54 [Arsenophonus nasoniae]QBY45337.1 RNA polymerase sigma-54 factor [Arsenophonus nasoniae]WGM05497.1 RNA polymerase factor sigma-54 [Arsenophonus nasoniae]WGM10508.1 RNA polymerase factor sigma-54 [Arsenophonus nasoniae]WGM15215.1 RNA polymerase factor sigma-54 [Arsenophonus nasoniae]CBA75340.1 RNA polymerase sigma-54 factor (sigma-N) [Arsenophonus nasoniae]